MTKITVVDLGWALAKLITKDDEPHRLILINPSDGSEGVFYPASDIHIAGDNIYILQEFLNTNLK